MGACDTGADRAANPAERRKLLGSLFDHVWQDNGMITAVKPRPAFAACFKALDQARPKPPRADQKRGVTKTGATGVKPAKDTGSRFGSRLVADS
jgi:hypothetical protein